MKQRSNLNNRIDRWLRDRPWKRLWYSLPALFAAGLLLSVLVLVLSRQSAKLNSRYDRLVQALLYSRQFEEARVASLHGFSEVKDERLRAQKLFYLALALNGLGRQQEAAKLMDLAAPLDHPGCAEAHLAVAEGLGRLLLATNMTSEALRALSRHETNAATENLHKIERHLLNALTLDPQSPRANELLGRYYINTRNPAKAQKYLMQIYSSKPEVALLLAQNCLLTNDLAGALQWAGRAINTFEQKILNSAPHYQSEDLLNLQASARLVQTLSVQKVSGPAPGRTAPAANQAADTPPQDGSVFWLSVARALVNKGRYAPALQTLEQQLTLNTNPVYASACADVCAAWADAIPPAQKDGPALRLQLIEKGLGYAPQRLKLQLLLARAGHATDETGPAARKLMDDAIAGTTNNEASAWWHFVLWTDGRMRGELPAARQHLQTAFQLAPQIPEIENDMAMDLASGSRAEVERALTLAQALVKQFPDNPGFRGTRGQILAKLGRNEEALADLEFAAPRLRYAAGTQRDLAKIYAALGRSVPVPQTQPAAVLGQARELAGQRKYADALAKLEPEMRQSPNAVFASAIADICAAWVDKLPPAQATERLNLIQKGLGYDPQHAGLMALLLQATHGAGDSGRAATMLLDKMVTTAVGEAAADWHLFLGQDTRSRGDLTASRQQLQTAYGLAPERSDIKSALAGVLVAGNQDDWQQGLQLIQPVLDEFPENPEFRNTRGLLLARLGQNKAAAADLEFAVTKLTNAAASRLELAKVYDALGKSQQAEQQRKLANVARH